MAMAHSGDSVAVDMPHHLIEKEHIISTGHGPVSVIVYGDQEKPPLITYPDLALNHTSCFRGLFFCPESASLLLHNFCIYHITPPGHELGAASISIDDSVPSIEDYSDQILEVLNHFRLGSVMCMGVMAGAYILTLFALKYSERVTGLILVSPLCRAPTWNEWFYNKFMSNLLYYYGMSDLLKEFLLHRYFSKEVCGSLEVPESDIVRSCRKFMSNLLYYYGMSDLLKEFLLHRYFRSNLEVCGSLEVPESDIVRSCKKLLDERNSINVWRYLQAIQRRPDITEELENLECRTIIFVGDSSPFHTEALHMTAKLGRKCCALVEVQACGSVVTEEQPHSMLIPLEYFLKGYGMYRSCWFNNGLRSCLGPSCINPKLLSPKSMGVKLKRIKTRVSPPPPCTRSS